ncbi:hypothetical protein Lal_00034591 [Lupinus albus]|uniref:GPI-anchored protein LLG1-like domain-containing protein n=1 Tax=Lupinus albus TaxID=3870 RepID=A0A6A5PJS0_LUPAL|nr:hypothetical protein Lalb_Chr03g0029411 [Lupinus albus]KAF1896890.1 hypothetical protein Lal_00034591 [Lupinus albus]
MGPYALFSAILSLFFLATLASASTSDNIFNQAEISAVQPDENLKACSIDFKNQNYTALISQCKGPNYTPESCCKAFKQFACPFAKYINDFSTDCAYSLFYYINLYGHYPEGLFFNKCLDGPKGIDCSSVKQ